MKTQDLKERVLRAVAQPALRLWLRHFWGPRCLARDPDCHCCKMWTAYDELFDLHPHWPDDVDTPTADPAKSRPLVASVTPPRATSAE